MNVFFNHFTFLSQFYKPWFVLITILCKIMVAYDKKSIFENKNSMSFSKHCVFILQYPWRNVMEVVCFPLHVRTFSGSSSNSFTTLRQANYGAKPDSSCLVFRRAWMESSADRQPPDPSFDGRVIRWPLLMQHPMLHVSLARCDIGNTKSTNQLEF